MNAYMETPSRESGTEMVPGTETAVAPEVAGTETPVMPDVSVRPVRSRRRDGAGDGLPVEPIPFWKNMPDEPTLFQSICRMTIALTARFVSGARARWIQSQPDTCQRVYFGNHTSHIDGPIIWATLPPQVRAITRPVAAADYWRKTAVRRFVTQHVFNTILVDRNEVTLRNNPISIILREIGTRYSIIIFPEGRRSTIGDMLEFRSGLYYLAKKRPDLELIPVYLDNMNRILPRGEVLPVPLLSTVSFGTPIWLEEGESKNEFLERARNAIIRLRSMTR